jgi:hypothetical protein
MGTAQQAGIGRAKYTRIEDGQVRVGLDDAITLAKIVGIPIEPDGRDYQLGLVQGLESAAGVALQLAERLAKP